MMDIGQTKASAYRFLGSLGCCVVTAALSCAQGRIETSHGTINVLLENANGLVLVTDSAESYEEADG